MTSGAYGAESGPASPWISPFVSLSLSFPTRTMELEQRVSESLQKQGHPETLWRRAPLGRGLLSLPDGQGSDPQP